MPTAPGLVQWAALLAVLVGALVIGFAVRGGRRTRRAPPPLPVPAVDGEAAPPPLAAVVVNPTKITQMDGERAWVAHRCTELGWRRPLWFETTLDDPGVTAARTALDAGAQTVIAYGGDGTVRAVAAGLEGSTTSLAILPMGTGNLLARNLGLPLSDLETALDVALTGSERCIDLGILEVDVSGEDEEPVRHVFLVMAGIGFDAEVMASVEPALKERVGWWAYVVAGVRRLRGRATWVTLRLDDGEPIRRRIRSVVVGNCGELTGGVRLLPEARPDDGWLDLVVVAPRRLLGWGAVVVSVLFGMRGVAGRTVVQHFRCRTLEIRAEKPLAVQLDGDPAGEARVLRARLDRLGLTVRTP